MPIDKTAKIWMDGKLVDWDDARIHVLTHTLHYGSGVFEGIRAYPTAGGPAVFRLTDHMRRLLQSAHFFVKDGKLITPPLSSGALEGITRDSVMTIARDLGYEVREENLLRTDLYCADEAFLTGTAAEIVPMRSVDDREIGEPGEITRKIQEIYFSTVHGEVPQYKEWLEYAGEAGSEPAGDLRHDAARGRAGGGHLA